MANWSIPDYYMVTLNGHPLKTGFCGPNGRREAEAFAERWQGERYRKGLLKHGDKGDHVEVKFDKAMEQQMKERIDLLKRGKPQTIWVLEAE